LGSDSNCFGVEGTLKPPAMGTHFSGLSLKKWSPGRAALKMFRLLKIGLGVDFAMNSGIASPNLVGMHHSL